MKKANSLFRRSLCLVLTILMLVSIGIIPASAESSPVVAGKSLDDWQDTINDLYASDPGKVGRVHKMQAFLMELAVHAKQLNPDFQIIPQDGIDVAYVDGDWNKGLNEDLMLVVDGWGIEGMVGTSASLNPGTNQQKYINLVKAGKFVSDTTTVNSREQLNNYLARAKAWGIVPYPRIGASLAESMYTGQRWSANSDYFWVEDPDTVGLGDRVDGTRVINKLTDAKTYLFHINGRPFDNWPAWDAEEAAELAAGSCDRTRIFDGYACGLLVPCEGGKYQPVASRSNQKAKVEAAIATYGTEWDWWWRAAGYTEDQARQVWIETLHNCPYDVIYIDSFYNHRALPENQTPLTKAEVDYLKEKPDGGTRKVIAYLSIGSAEQNRWYCQDDWTWVDSENLNSDRNMKSGSVKNNVYTPYTDPTGATQAPAWLAFGYGGSYEEEAIVQWWNPEWRDIIINGGGQYHHKTTGDNTSSIDRIIAQGFDGVYLDNVSAVNSGYWTAWENYYLQHGGIPGETDKGAVVAQNLDYTEFVGDVPNPNRGFYRASSCTVPVTIGEGGKTSGDIAVGSKNVQSTPVDCMITHLEFNLANFSSNAALSRGTRYTSSYRAPENVSIKSRGDAEPWDYDTHFDYWKANVAPTWPHGESQPLTQDALTYISNTLQKVRENKGNVIVRFTYDQSGYSWVDCDHPQDGYIDQLVWNVEPDQNMVLTHIAQLKPILYEYEDVITCVDGGFFGPWGEMHSSSFGQSTAAYAWLLNALLDAVPDSRQIVVQPGAFMSWYNTYYGTKYTFATIDQIPVPQRGTPEARFGMFNDSFCYGMGEHPSPEEIPDDWGSISEGISWPKSPVGTASDFDRAKVLTWMRNQNAYYGGEAQGDQSPWNTFPYIPWEASYTHAAYLNADYEGQVHKRWKNFIYNEENMSQEFTNPLLPQYTKAIFDPLYDGKTGLEYWRDRLGYRLVVRDSNASEWVAQNGNLVFNGKIQNVGFGNVLNKQNVTIILQNKADGSTYSYLTDLDARDWLTDLDTRATNTKAYRSFSVNVNLLNFGEVPEGQYNIFMKINDPKEQSANKRCIRFANNGDMWNEELGANLLGSTEVKGVVLTTDEKTVVGIKDAIEAASFVIADPIAKDWAGAQAQIKEILAGVDTKNAKIALECLALDDTSCTFRATISKGILAEPVETADLSLTTTYVEPVVVNPFVDIANLKQSFQDAILWAYNNDIAAGATESTYNPDGSCTRAQVVTFLWRAAGKPAPAAGTVNPFKDVKEGAYYYDAILWAVEKGIAYGITSDTFAPGATVTRGQFVTFLWRYLDKPMATGTTNPFSDVKEGGFYNAILWGAENGVVSGYSNGTFCPNNTCTRAHVAAFLYRALA